MAAAGNNRSSGPPGPPGTFQGSGLLRTPARGLSFEAGEESSDVTSQAHPLVRPQALALETESPSPLVARRADFQYPHDPPAGRPAWYADVPKIIWDDDKYIKLREGVDYSLERPRGLHYPLSLLEDDSYILNEAILRWKFCKRSEEGRATFEPDPDRFRAFIRDQPDFAIRQSYVSGLQIKYPWLVIDDVELRARVGFLDPTALLQKANELGLVQTGLDENFVPPKPKGDFFAVCKARPESALGNSGVPGVYSHWLAQPAPPHMTFEEYLGHPDLAFLSETECQQAYLGYKKLPLDGIPGALDQVKWFPASEFKAFKQKKKAMEFLAIWRFEQEEAARMKANAKQESLDRVAAAIAATRDNCGGSFTPLAKIKPYSGTSALVAEGRPGGLSDEQWAVLCAYEESKGKAAISRNEALSTSSISGSDHPPARVTLAPAARKGRKRTVLPDTKDHEPPSGSQRLGFPILGPEVTFREAAAVLAAAAPAYPPHQGRGKDRFVASSLSPDRHPHRRRRDSRSSSSDDEAGGPPSRGSGDEEGTGSERAASEDEPEYSDQESTDDKMGRLHRQKERAALAEWRSQGLPSPSRVGEVVKESLYPCDNPFGSAWTTADRTAYRANEGYMLDEHRAHYENGEERTMETLGTTVQFAGAGLTVSDMAGKLFRIVGKNFNMLREKVSDIPIVFDPLQIRKGAAHYASEGSWPYPSGIPRPMAAAIYPYRVEVYDQGIAKLESVKAIQRLGYRTLDGGDGPLATRDIQLVTKNVESYYDFINSKLKQYYYTHETTAGIKNTTKHCVVAFGVIVAFDINTRSLIACNLYPEKRPDKPYRFEHLHWVSYSARWQTLYEPMLKDAPCDEFHFSFGLQLMLFRCPACSSRAGTEEFCSINSCKSNVNRRANNPTPVPRLEWLQQGKKRTEAGYETYLRSVQSAKAPTLEYFRKNQNEVRVVRPLVRSLV